MPYITKEQRDDLDPAIQELINTIIVTNCDGGSQAGRMNYVITKLLDAVYPDNRYKSMAEAVSVLEMAKLEFYRRVAAPYEDQKMYDNGDAYVREQ